jgi:hypothetical protein
VLKGVAANTVLPRIGSRIFKPSKRIETVVRKFKKGTDPKQSSITQATEQINASQSQQNQHTEVVTTDGIKVQVQESPQPSDELVQLRDKNTGKQKSDFKNKIANDAQGVRDQIAKTTVANNKYTFKNGKYQDAPYHTAKGNSIKSPRPINGQHALDNSFQIKDTSSHRIAISNGQIVVLKATSKDLFHGYVVTWDQLEQEMKNVLINNGLVKPNGKIIK